MKLSRSAKTLAAFGLGACLFVSTAFADMVLGSGYDKLKSSIKNTFSQMENGLDSYTFIQQLSITLDGEVLTDSHTTTKVDNVNKLQEELNISKTYLDEERQSMRYDDKNQSIWQGSYDNKTYVNNYPADRAADTYMFSDPLNEDGAAEIEKIIDAVVGNLKDLVQVEQSAAGEFNFNGSLNASQVPALVNGVSSFGIKQVLKSEIDRDKSSKLPSFKSDVNVTSVKGSAVENEKGVLTNLTGSVEFTGKDADGKEHQIDFNIALELTDINSTTVNKPDTRNAIVEEHNQNPVLSDLYVGTYKNNIVIKDGAKVVKIGERKLVVDKISANEIVGSFEEIVYEGYEDKYQAKKLTFTKIDTSEMYRNLIIYVDDAGNTGNAVISDNGGLDQVYFIHGISIEGDSGYSYDLENYNSNYFKVFE